METWYAVTQCQKTINLEIETLRKKSWPVMRWADEKSLNLERDGKRKTKSLNEINSEEMSYLEEK